MTALTVVRPIAFSDALLQSCTVPEDPNPAWDPGVTYAAGARVHSTVTHKVYQSLVAGNLGQPLSNTTRWIEVSATNRWKMFDTSNTTATTANGSMTYVFRPRQVVNCVALLGVVASSVRIRMTDPAEGLVYDRTFQLAGAVPGSNWYDYFFAQVVVKDQVLALDLPPYSGADIQVDVIGGSVVSCTTLVFGYQRVIGKGVHYGARVSIQDYSRVETNDFGETSFVPRSYAKRADITTTIDNGLVTATQTFLASIRAIPCLWIGYEEIGALTLFGFYKEFNIVISYFSESDCELSLQGLT
jgi:hypothetical protein